MPPERLPTRKRRPRPESSSRRPRPFRHDEARPAQDTAKPPFPEDGGFFCRNTAQEGKPPRDLRTAGRQQKRRAARRNTPEAAPPEAEVKDAGRCGAERRSPTLSGSCAGTKSPDMTPPSGGFAAALFRAKTTGKTEGGSKGGRTPASARSGRERRARTCRCSRHKNPRTEQDVSEAAGRVFRNEASRKPPATRPAYLPRRLRA